MTITFKPGTYYHGIWIVSDSTHDVMLSLYKEDGEWRVTGRLRTYVDEKVFNSKDKKRWFTGGVPPGNEPVAYLEKVTDEMCKKLGGQKHYIDFQCDGSDMDKINKAMKACPMMHYQEHTTH